eukprot:TRINITY_DN36109_c0_g1_i2.p1 TRINITY_DN36109_c0_g1~~TRINITY_DN36109_c0_g1_i2.p1  ORF type:complete len:389 (+),score=73.80 TRINITY_DN36109_c0_g1_i2:351-1517(+)
MFGLLDSLAAALPGDHCQDRAEVLAGISRSEESWHVTDLEGKTLGSFDTLICSYDYFMRGTRKAALRAVLEDKLPMTAPVMRAVAGAVDACAFALAAHVPSAAELTFDVAHVEGVPELALAIRNSDDGAERRGLPREGSWLLVATSAWTDAVRPNATSRWDKDDVAHRMLEAFAKLTKVSPGRPLRPPYHWGGFASLTDCKVAFAYDSSNKLGFVGDFFVSHGANGALSSGLQLASHLAASTRAGRWAAAPQDVLPAAADWKARHRQTFLGEEDTGALVGEPAGTDDHSWPTLEQLQTGNLRPGQRCMNRYKRRGILQQDIAWLHGHSAGPQKSKGRGRWAGGSSGEQTVRGKWSRHGKGGYGVHDGSAPADSSGAARCRNWESGSCQ